MTSKLPESWEKIDLGEIVEIISGGTPKRKEESYWNGDIPWISVRDFPSEGKYIKRTDEKITEKGLENSSANMLNSNDIIISARGTVGKLGIVQRPMAFNQSCYGLRSNELFLKNKFFYYFLKYDIERLKRQGHGSVFNTIIKSTLNNLSINVPPVPEQKSIAAILSALDDKVEINNKINKNLEQQAQEIFKHWFIDFEFPNKEGMPYKSSGGKFIESEVGLIPDGWEVKSLIKIAEFLNGVAIAKYKPVKGTEDSLPAVKIRELRQGHTDASSDQCLTSIDEKYIIDDFDMIFSWSGSLLIDIWVGSKAILNQHLFKVTSKEYDQWYYYYWTKHFLDEFIQIAKSKATTMGHINRSHLSEAKVLLPDPLTYKEIGKTLSNILNLKMQNQKQNQKLSELRDTLLPKLMNGELRIPLD